MTAHIAAEDAQTMSRPELLLVAQVLDAGLPAPLYGRNQWQFCAGRKWRVDLGWPEHGLICEVEGQVWGRLVRCHNCGALVKAQSKKGRWYNVRAAGGRHVRGAGFEADAEKYNAAELLGLTVLRVTPAMIRDGRALASIRQALQNTERKG